MKAELVGYNARVPTNGARYLVSWRILGWIAGSNIVLENDHGFLLVGVIELDHQTAPFGAHRRLVRTLGDICRANGSISKEARWSTLVVL
jgi:hypothetical protein